MSLFDGSNLLTVAEVADCLGVSTQSVRRHIKDGRLKHVRVGHLVRLRPYDVLSFVDPATVEDKRVKGPRESVS